jgi:mannan endo-1,4-beta-mannosidase
MRKHLILTLTLLTGMTMKSLATDSFVKVNGTHFVLDEHRWYVCGANFWYGAYLGLPANPEGRARLGRELDRLKKIGVNNLRVLGASEDCTVARTLKPAIQAAPGKYNEEVLVGLDYLIQEAGKRQMKLVVFLNNYWDWSGGMPQYISWAEGQPAQGLADLPWEAYNRHLAKFYRSEAAQKWYREYLAMIISRTNTLTGKRYRDDPTIMTWELANEPRPGMSDDKEALMATFERWIDGTAAYIHSLDSNHLVTTGSEGIWGGLDSEENFLRCHRSRWIDYAVFHLWPKNWSWFKVEHYQETIGRALKLAREYAEHHFAMGATLGKPMVLEEFGLDRDGGLTLNFGVTARDQYYAEMFAVIEESLAKGGAAAGSSFWLWGGEGRPHPITVQPSDLVGAGDMGQEPPGLNTVFDADVTTVKLLSDHFARLNAADENAPSARQNVAAPSAATAH